MIARESQILPLTPTADHTGYEGYAVKNSSGSAALIVSATATAPIGVIIQGRTTSAKDSVALPGYQGTVKVKLNSSPGTVNAFTVLQLAADGTGKADAADGSARILYAVALEAGSANELIEARLIKPIKIAAATTNTITDSSGGTASTSAIASMTGVDGTGSNAAPLTATRNNIATLAAELAAVKADLAAVLAAVNTQ